MAFEADRQAAVVPGVSASLAGTVLVPDVMTPTCGGSILSFIMHFIFHSFIC